MKKKYIVTGGAGFIGSNVIKALNKKGVEDIIVVDNLTDDKKINLEGLQYNHYLDKNQFLDGIKDGEDYGEIDVIIHLGARTDTTEKDKEFLIENNTRYSKYLFDFSVKNNCSFIYASSAATYGDGSKGFSDEERDLKPLHGYGYSKHLFDQMVLDSFVKPKQWVGMKFFNVYGPNEYHKGLMASVVYHGYLQIKEKGEIKLFKSYKKDYKDGDQKRDFIYVKDVVKIIEFFLENRNISGIFNVGTGRSRSFQDLAYAIFKAMNIKPKISFIDMPESIRDTYQYFTQADMNKLKKMGYTQPFFELEEGVEDYVKNYLEKLLN